MKNPLPYFRGRILAIWYTLFGIPAEVLEMKISDLKIDPKWSRRIEVILDMLDIKTVGQLVQKTERDLLRIPDFGQARTNRTKEALALQGLCLK